MKVLALFALVKDAQSRAMRGDAHSEGAMSKADMEKTLLAEIEGHVGSVAQRGRLARLESALRPIFDSLPKNEHGNLGHVPVRYALHRIFVQRHGWYIKGLEPSGDGWSNNTSPSSVLKERVSSYVEELFEQRLGGQGFNLHDTAVLAATLEHLIHDEAGARLSKAYELLGYKENMALTKEQTDGVLDAYMKLYVLGEETAASVPDTDMPEVFPGWGETQKFVREVRNGFHRSKTFSLQDMNDVVEEVSEQFGHFQDAECGQMKTKLIALGDGGVGRVYLRDFYKASLDGDTFEFQESTAYLRELGALDETDPEHPSVIVPNYITSASNCIASSSLYNVCCLNECEQLMGHLEKAIDAPEAEPKVIAGLVSALPSSTVKAPRQLSPGLLSKLDDIGSTHGGSVQLHGRLFGQWMHHAFPRECPFPHVAGSFTPRTPDEWLAEQGNQTEQRADMASQAEMELYAKKEIPEYQSHMSHWSEEEELIVPFEQRAKKGSGVFWWWMKVLMFLAALFSLATKVTSPIKLAKTVMDGVADNNLKKGFDNDFSWTDTVTSSASRGSLTRRNRTYLPA